MNEEDAQLFSLFSHEIKNSLTIILGHSELLATIPFAAEKQKMMGEKITHAAHKIEEVLLALSFLYEKNSTTLPKEKCTISEVVNKVHTDLFLQKTSINIIKDAVIEGYPSLLHIAFKNLVENALKYGKKKKIDIIVKKTAKASLIEIIDQGLGIDKEELKNVFAPFYRGKNTQQQIGMGLGLFLTKKIIQKHGGEIAISSQKGEGTKVSVSFPF